MSFSDEELAYLRSQQLARIATVSTDGQPDAVPVGFEYDGTYLYIGGIDPARTRKFRNVRDGNTKVAVILDDLKSVSPWVPRYLRIYGDAELVEQGEPAAACGRPGRPRVPRRQQHVVADGERGQEHERLGNEADRATPRPAPRRPAEPGPPRAASAPAARVGGTGGGGGAARAARHCVGARVRARSRPLRRWWPTWWTWCAH